MDLADVRIEAVVQAKERTVVLAGVAPEGQRLAIKRSPARRIGRVERAAVAPILWGPGAIGCLRRHEARVLASLDHPGVPALVGQGELDGGPFVAMTWADGVPLDRFSLTDGREVEELSAIARGVADVLAHAHARGVVHRDLGPTNILVHRDDGRIAVSVVDWELADLDGDRVIGVVGRRPWRAPELDRLAEMPRARVDGRADLYALGATLAAVRGDRQVPERLAVLLGSLLAALPADRLARADDVAAVLDGSAPTRAVGGPAAAPDGLDPQAEAVAEALRPCWVAPTPRRIRRAIDAARAWGDPRLEGLVAGLEAALADVAWWVEVVDRAGPETAVEAASHLAGLDPSPDRAWALVGAHLQVDALADLGAVEDPRPAFQLARAVALSALRDGAGAIAAIDTGFLELLGDPEVVEACALVRAAAGDWAGVDDLLDELAALGGGGLVADIARAARHRAAGRFDEALAVQARIEEASPGSPAAALARLELAAVAPGG